jgi:integrase
MPKRDSKNKRPSRLPLPKLAVLALKQMPSYGKSEYLFPAKPNVRFKDVEKFSKPYAWDLGKRFKRICTKAGINDLRIHDLRHFATTMLFMEGVPDEIIRKMTGHRSEELQRYKHFSTPFLQQTGERIAGQLQKHISTFSGTKAKKTPKSKKAIPKGSPQTPGFPGFSGGVDGTRTRDL